MTVKQQESIIGSWEWDFNSDKVEISKELYPVYDISPDTFEGKFDSIIKVIHPDDVDKFTGSLTGNLTSDKVISLEYRVVHKNGTVRKIYSEANVKFDESSKPLKYIFIVQDITNNIQKEEQKNSTIQSVQLSGYYDKIKENERFTMLQELYFEFGLVAAIAWIIYDFEHKCNIKVTHNLGIDINIPYEISIIILKILKSSLSNIAKHSRATAVNVGLDINCGYLTFRIADNGIGIPESTNLTKGFVKMDINVDKLGGELNVYSDNGSGLVISVKIPLNK